MLLANQLKQLAKDYGIFIFSATQVNASAMMDDGEFKNETCIRGAKSLADKADVAYVMSKVNDKNWNSITPQLRVAARNGQLMGNFLEEKPTHVIDIYKMRRGRYKNVRIWIKLDLGTGQREDLFITTADNQPIDTVFDLFSTEIESVIEWRDDND